MIWIAWFDHVEESFSCKEVQVKKLCMHMKASCLPVVPCWAPVKKQKQNKMVAKRCY